MKKLTKALVLCMACLPLVSFAEEIINLPKLNYITDEQGNRHQDNRFDLISEFKNGYAQVAIGNFTALTPSQEDIRKSKWGIIDKTGKIIIPLAHHTVYDYVPNVGFVFAVVPNGQERGKFGLYDKNGKMLIPAIYDNYLDFSERLSIFEKDGKFGYGDATGNIIIPLQYQDATEFINGKAFVKTNDHYQMIDKKNHVLTSYQFNHLSEYNENLYVIFQNEKYGIMTVDGIIKTQPIYDRIGVLLHSESLAPFKQNDRWGFMDRNAEIVIPAQYEEVSYFVNGIVAVKKHGKVGFIDTNDKVVIPFMYDAPQPNLIDFDIKVFEKEGEIYSTYRVDDNDVITVIKNGKWGVIDKNNQTLIDFDYDRIKMQPFWMPVIVTKNGKTYEIPNPLKAKQ